MTPPREGAAGSLSKDPPFVSTFHVCSVIPRVTYGVTARRRPPTAILTRELFDVFFSFF